MVKYSAKSRAGHSFSGSVNKLKSQAGHYISGPVNKLKFRAGIFFTRPVNKLIPAVFFCLSWSSNQNAAYHYNTDLVHHGTGIQPLIPVPKMVRFQNDYPNGIPKLYPGRNIISAGKIFYE